MAERGIAEEQIYTALAREQRRTPGEPGTIWIHGLVQGDDSHRESHTEGMCHCRSDANYHGRLARQRGEHAMISQKYDLDAGALYIGLADHQMARTAQVDAGTLVDFDSAGNVVGIEVIQPDRSWPLEEILTRFAISQEDARELRAYFPYPNQIVPPAHPAARVPVAVS